MSPVAVFFFSKKNKKHMNWSAENSNQLTVVIESGVTPSVGQDNTCMWMYLLQFRQHQELK